MERKLLSFYFVSVLKWLTDANKVYIYTADSRHVWSKLNSSIGQLIQQLISQKLQKNEKKFYKKKIAQNGASPIKFTKQTISYEM